MYKTTPRLVHQHELKGRKSGTFRIVLPQDLGAKSLQTELITSKKREILPLETEAVFHSEHHKALLPNARSVNDLGEPSAQEYNCQFAGISPAIRQNKITHQRKSFARCSHASLTHLISTHHCSAGMRVGCFRH